MKMIKGYEYTVDAVGGAYGIYYIQSILGVIVLILTIFNILLKAGILIYSKVKKRKIEEIPQVIDDTIDKINEVKDGK